MLKALVHTRGPAAVRGVIPDANLQVLLAHAGCSSSGASPNARAGGGLERFSNGSDGDHLASANPFGSMILLDGASIASTSSNLNGGYLNVTAIVTAIDYYMDKHADNTVICLVPAHWFVPRPTGDQTILRVNGGPTLPRLPEAPGRRGRRREQKRQLH